MRKRRNEKLRLMSYDPFQRVTLEEVDLLLQTESITPFSREQSKESKILTPESAGTVNQGEIEL